MNPETELLLRLIQDGILARATRYGRFDVFRILLGDYITILLGANSVLMTKTADQRGEHFQSTVCFDLEVPAGSQQFCLCVENDNNDSRSSGIATSIEALLRGEGAKIVERLQSMFSRHQKSAWKPANPTPDQKVSFLVEHVWPSAMRELRAFLGSLAPIYPALFQENASDDTMRVYVTEPSLEEMIHAARTSAETTPLPPPLEVERARRTGQVSWAADRAALAVPVHVAGLPWIVLHFQLGEKEQRFAAYHAYRELVPDVAESLRRWARQQFRQSCKDAVRSVILDANQITALNRHTFLHDRLSERLSSVSGCLPGPCLRVVDRDQQDGVVANLNCGIREPVFVSITPFNRQHSAEIDLFDVEKPDRLKEHLEQTASAVVSELAKRGWEEAAATAHIMGTHIESMRSLLLFEESETAQTVARGLDQLAFYRSAVCSAFRGEVTANSLTSGTIEDGWNSLVRVAATDKLNPVSIVPQSPSPDVSTQPIRYSDTFLEIVFETCVSNVHKHSAELSMTVSLHKRGNVLWLSVGNKMRGEKTLPDGKLAAMNSGTLDDLGIHTLHVASMTWFKTRPEFEVSSINAANWFKVSLPIALL